MNFKDAHNNGDDWGMKNLLFIQGTSRYIKHQSGCITLAFCVAFLAGCHQQQAKDAAASSTVEAASSKNLPADTVVLAPEEQRGVISTTKLALEKVQDRVQFPGRIVLPDNESWRVGVLSPGRIERVYANLGDYVQKGAVLARMHSHDVHEAQAAYGMAVAEKGRLDSAASMAQINYDRMQRLYALRAASVEQVEQARQELVNAKTARTNGDIDVTRSRTHLEENLGISADSIGKEGDAELIPIVAPASGYVLQKNVTPGTTVAPASDLFVLGDLKHLWMLASVGQDVLPQLRLGQVTTITLPGVPGERYEGRITNLGQEFDPATRRLQVRIEITSATGILRPEMLATAEIAVGEGHPLLMVASEAVQQINGQDVVFVRTGTDHFVARPVRVGPTVNEDLVLLEGVREGDEVVVKGSFVLKSQMLKAAMQGD